MLRSLTMYRPAADPYAGFNSREGGGPGRGADRAAWPHHTVGRYVRTKTQLIFCVRAGALIGVRVAHGEERGFYTATARF